MNSRNATKQAERVTPATAALHAPINLPRVLRSLKILDRHLDCIAIVYVRQSDPQQVLNRRRSHPKSKCSVYNLRQETPEISQKSTSNEYHTEHFT